MEEKYIDKNGEELIDLDEEGHSLSTDTKKKKWFS